MPSRMHADSPLWLLCGCGGLPFIGLAKGFLVCIPLAIYCTLSTAAIALAMLPHDVVLTYRTLAAWKQIGPNLTVLGMVLLPVPLALYPILVTIGAFLASLIGGFGMPIVFTFEDDEPLFTGGMRKPFTIAREYLHEFWEFNSKAVFCYLNDLRRAELRPGETAFDISIAQLLKSALVAAIGVIIDGLLFGLVATIYLIPCTARVYIEQNRWYFQQALWDRTMDNNQRWIARILLPVHIVLQLAMAPLCLVIYASILICGLGIGIGAAAVSYKHDFSTALRWIVSRPPEFEEVAERFVVRKGSYPHTREATLFFTGRLKQFRPVDRATGEAISAY